MTSDAEDAASDYRNIMKALGLLSAYRSDLTVRVQENPVFQMELGLVESQTADPAELGELCRWGCVRLGRSARLATTGGLRVGVGIQMPGTFLAAT